MTISERSLILIDESSDRITLNNQLEGMLRKEMRPVLWFRDGLFCIVHREILKNMLDTVMPFEQWIHWSQGLQIGFEEGMILSGLE
jgi:hypothetical protein